MVLHDKPLAYLDPTTGSTSADRLIMTSGGRQGPDG